jgi:hypothetical protein
VDYYRIWSVYLLFRSRRSWLCLCAKNACIIPFWFFLRKEFLWWIFTKIPRRCVGRHSWGGEKGKAATESVKKVLLHLLTNLVPYNTRFTEKNIPFYWISNEANLWVVMEWLSMLPGYCRRLVKTKSRMRGLSNHVVSYLSVLQSFYLFSSQPAVVLLEVP